MHSSVLFVESTENFPLSCVCLCVLIQDRVQPTLATSHGEDTGGWRQGHRGTYICCNGE